MIIKGECYRAPKEANEVHRMGKTNSPPKKEILRIAK